MSSTYSPILRTELIGSGDQAGTWGSTTNLNFQYIFESAIAGYVAVTVSPTSNNQVLTYVNGPSANASLDQSVYGILKLNAGTLGANFNIFAPPVSKQYIVWNNTAYTASFYNSTVIGNTTAAGSAAVIPAGAKVVIWSDGTSFYGNDTAVGNFSVAGNLAVTGTTSLTTGSISGVMTAPTAAAGTNTTQLATTAFVTQNAVLTGALIMWPTGTAPSGYLLCNGAAVSRTTYASLFAVVGTTFGAGNGSTTFNTPNYTNRMPYGTTIGTTGGSADAIVVGHTHTASSSSSVSDPTHTHGISDPQHQHPQNANGGGAPGYIGAFGANGGPVDGGFTGFSPTGIGINGAATGISVSTTTTIDAAGSPGTNANLPPYLGINFIIKT